MIFLCSYFLHFHTHVILNKDYYNFQVKRFNLSPPHFFYSNHLSVYIFFPKSSNAFIHMYKVLQYKNQTSSYIYNEILPELFPTFLQTCNIRQGLQQFPKIMLHDLTQRNVMQLLSSQKSALSYLEYLVSADMKHNILQMYCNRL